MKKLFLVYFIFLFASCQIDDNISKNEDNAIDLLKIENVNALSGEARILSYRMLNSSEKYYIWNKRHNQILISDKNILSSVQINFINEMYSSLKREYFELNSRTKFIKYYDEYLPEMKEKGLLIFTIEEMNKYFSNFNNQTSYPHVVGNIKSGEIILNSTANREGFHCKCSTVDDWCNSGDCYAWNCGEDDFTDPGCGWWLQEDCNGICARSDNDDFE